MCAALAFVGGSTVLAQAPPADGKPADGKPLAGKNAFSMDQFENSLWNKAKRASEKRKFDARGRKISKLLKLVDSPSYTNKADALFRLAEAHWDQAKYEYFLSREKFDKEMECFEEKRCKQEPKEPNEDFSTAIDYYRKVLLADPNYSRLDQVTYYLGRAAIEDGKAKVDKQLQKEGEKHLQDVVQKFPKSKHVPASHLTLAEHYFDKDSLYYAKTNYEKIIQNFPKHPMFNYALYKLGWVYFNLAEFEKTVDTFKRVVASIKGAESQGFIDFRNQALNDLVMAWAEIDNGWKTARTYFVSEVGEEDAYKKLEKMAGLLVTKDKDEEALDLYAHLIQHNRTNPAIVEYYSAIMEVRNKIEDKAEIEGSINEITDFFDKKGQWHTANKGNGEAVKGADELVSSNLIYIANHHHRAAQKAEDKRKGDLAKSGYNNAAKYYKQFIDRYPNHEESYKLNFFYAEILFDELGEYMKAAEQYEKVLEKDQKGDFVEDAALGVVYAMEKELDKQGIRSAVKKGQINIVKVNDDLRAQEDKDIKVAELHPLEKRMVTAADRYVKVLSANLKDAAWKKKNPKRGKMIPNMMYISAEMFHAKGQFKNAVERLQVIFDLFPKHKMASHAVNLIIDAYKRLKRWEKIEYWARELIKKKNFQFKTKSELEKIVAISKNEHAKDLTKQRRFDEAVTVQREIVDEFGRKNPDVASTALFNVGAIHEIARRFPQAVSAYEEVIDRYGKKEVAVKAQSAIGLLYENQTEFEKAAESFVGMQRFKKYFKKNPEAAKQARQGYANAGVLYKALEQYDKANEVFKNYIKLYPKADNVTVAAFESATVLELKGDAAKGSDNDAYVAAGKQYEKVAKKFGRKDKQFMIRGLAASGLAYKKADKVKHRKKVEKLLRKAVKEWNKVADSPDVEPATRGYSALATFHLAEYEYDDYNKLKIDALSRSGRFDMGVLTRTLTAKAEALVKAEKSFDKVLDFKDKGMAAASAFRLGQILYEFAESLFNAPVPPQLNEEQADEYRFALEEFAAPIQERSLAAFTAALKQAVKDNVYNEWSRKSAVFAAKVNPDEFPLAEFPVKPDKTVDTIQSTSFVKAVRRGSEVVDYVNFKKTDKDKAKAETTDAPKEDPK